MIRFESQLEQADLAKELRELDMELAAKMARVLEQVGFEVVSYLRGLGGGMRPPARPGEPNREAHPGGWADITSNLANAYRFELYAAGDLIRWVPVVAPLAEDENGRVQGVIVKRSPTRPKFPLELRFLNGMDYAAVLEERDGYWVLREITERGGPVDRSLRNIIRSIAPEFDLR